MLILFYVFFGLSVIFAILCYWLYRKHRQWRQQLEPKFNNPISSQKTGLEIARTILDANQLEELPVRSGASSTNNVFKSTEGDYGVIYLSPEYYGHQSLRALAVAAHECGHAIRFHLNKKLSFLSISIYPGIALVSIPALTLASLMFFQQISIWLFMSSAIPGITLIVFSLLEENNATSEGIKMLKRNKLITKQEKDFVKQYLNCNLLDYFYKYLFYISAWNFSMALLIMAQMVYH